MHGPEIYQTGFDNYNYCNISPELNLEECYPESYRQIYPIVCECCDKNTKMLTKENINEMVEMIYQTVKVKLKVENRNIERKIGKEGETRQVERSQDFLRDLITILLLNRLRQRRPHHRPPMPSHPPFPGPGMPPQRPPYREYPIY